jgi:hypothetical protein
VFVEYQRIENSFYPLLASGTGGAVALIGKSIANIIFYFLFFDTSRILISNIQFLLLFSTFYFEGRSVLH